MFNHVVGLALKEIRSTFHAENTLPKLLCKAKARLAADDRNNIIYEIDFHNCKAVNFDESKKSLKLRSEEQKRSVRNCNCKRMKLQNIIGKQITALAGVKRKLLNRKAG